MDFFFFFLARRGAGFPVGNDSGNILSPRSSESGIGMKMVEYVLASTPNKMETLEPRMRNLVIVCLPRFNNNNNNN